MDEKYIDESFDLLRTKQINCLITTKLADEGIDIREIDTLLLVGGGKAYVAAIQRVGRGLRIKANGGALEVIEFLDLTNPYLQKHANMRLDHYDSEQLFDTSKVVEAEDILNGTYGR
jgi:superfamily II DNA or RNA helicase